MVLYLWPLAEAGGGDTVGPISSNNPLGLLSILHLLSISFFSWVVLESFLHRSKLSIEMLEHLEYLWCHNQLDKDFLFSFGHVMPCDRNVWSEWKFPCWQNHNSRFFRIFLEYFCYIWRRNQNKWIFYNFSLKIWICSQFPFHLSKYNCLKLSKVIKMGTYRESLCNHSLQV